MVRLGFSIAEIHAFLVDRPVKMVRNLRIPDVKVRGRGQPAVIHGRGGNGAGIHQGNRAHLSLTRLAALAVREIARRVADGELAVCRRIARTEARSAEAFPDDDTGPGDIGQGSVPEQLQIGRHGAGIDTHGKGAVSDGTAAENIGHGADIVKRTAGTAGHQALFHPDSAVMHLAHQVNAGTDNL